MKSRDQIRDELQAKLLSSKAYLLWSFDVKSMAKVSDQLIIEKFLEFGDEKEWADLKQAYSLDEIFLVWKSQMLMFGKDPVRQEALVVFFFDASDPAEYISGLRKAQINELVERGS